MISDKNSFLKDINYQTECFKGFKHLENIYSFIDLTNLSSSAKNTDIIKLCTQAKQTKYDTINIPPVAAVCVYPVFIKQCKNYLEPSEIAVASVSAGFPHAQTFSEIKFIETEMAVQHEADEIDIVLNLSAFLDGQESLAFDEIKTIKQICGNKHLKVILETSILKEETRIYEASLLALEAGADFIKTSTGKEGSVADIYTFYTMCTAISEFFKRTGTKAGIKAAGGITSTIEALRYYAIVHELLGNLWISKKTFRIGASRLLQNILIDLKALTSEKK